VDFLLRGESVHNNPYLQEFARAPWLAQVLEAPECQSLLAVRGKSLRKELSEAFGALAACRRALAKLGRQGSDGAGVKVVDLCCGKGFGSLVLSLSMPRAQILAVDKNPDMELAHFRGRSNLRFLELDVTLPDAGARVQAALAESEGPALSEGGLAGGEDADACETEVLLFVGIHLCGALSCHAARLYREAPGPTALVLSPCCLDGRRVAVKRHAKLLKVDPHLYWCLTLLFGEVPSSGCRRELFIDHDVLSAKNTFLLATHCGA